MKKLTPIILILLVFIFSGSAQAWEARMAGMGNPRGLVYDNSDFLTHPSMITGGSGVQFFIHYDYAYTDVSDWDTNLNFLELPVSLQLDYDISGHRDRHEVRAGTAFPVGSGRMGVFFSYHDEDGSYDGKIVSDNMYPDDVDVSMDSDIRDYTFSLFFGIPLNSISLGAEAGIAHTREENRTFEEVSGGPESTNQIFGVLFPSGIGGYPSLHHYMIPYDSEYWEGFLKAGISVGQGPVRIGFTGRGGLILSGENNLEYELSNTVNMDMEGYVDGWSAGADLWLRFMVGGGFSLPFLATVDYSRKERDGRGIFENMMVAGSADAEYEQNEESLQIEAGGGIEKEFSKGSRIAAGAYYQYLANETDLSLELVAPTGGTINLDQYNCPDSDEHRVALKIAGEIKISRAFSFLVGAGGFFGWVDYDIASNMKNVSVLQYSEDVAADGKRWGASAALGASIKAGSIIIEPFITGAYSELHLEGEGPIFFLPAGNDFRVEFENDRDEFLVGGGVSVIFN